MFLKRLELKGFKSFADKCIVTLEPGISAIVGPNGSGKSNICDAILWVLGERNAKSLRGGVMEDVIFAGSSKRSAVSVAEVSLVLDNADGTIPIEYNEISLSRRLYRSGESEYLINGVLARRLDVLDILHDSGIGTDTNSIISQGHLDSILQSQPLDRRTLIEEAAGVLKHKQRKLRSQKKLERMDLNLERISDIMAEIERQLKPLRIKAKRAAAYDGLVEELSKLTLEIAVDDLKKIKSKWNNVESKKIELENIVNKKHDDLENKENQLDSLRKKMSNQNSDLVDYSSKQRKLNSYIDKLSAYAMLLQQKAQNAKEKQESLNDSSYDNNISNEKKQILDNIKKIEENLVSLKLEYQNLKQQTDNSKSDVDKAQTKFDDYNLLIENKSSELNNLQQELSNHRSIVSKASENLVEHQAKIASIKSSIDEYKIKLNNSNMSLKESEKTKAEKQKVLDETNIKFEKNQNSINKLKDRHSYQKDQLENLKKDYDNVNSDILALDKIIETNFEQSSNAVKWLNANKGAFDDVMLFSDNVKVEDKFINLLDTLLGNYSSSYIANFDTATNIAEKIKSSNEADGSLCFVSELNNDFIKNSLDCSKKAAKEFNGFPLFDKVELSNETSLSAIVNVVVFNTLNDAKNAYKKYNSLCCVSLDGTIIYPDGRYYICDPFNSNLTFDNKNNQSIISYKKSLKKLKKESDKLNKKLRDSENKLEESDNQLQKLREEEIVLKNSLATNQAEYDFSCKYHEEQKVANEDNYNKINQLQNQLSEIQSSFKEKNPDVENSKIKIDELSEKVKDLQNDISIKQQEATKIRVQNDEKIQEYHDLNVKLAALEERVNSNSNNLENEKSRLSKQEEQEAENIEELKKSRLLFDQYNNLSGIFSRLASFANKDMSRLDKNFGAVNKAAVEIQKKLDCYINEANEARKDYEIENKKLSDIQVELGRLEVQVQNAVDAIDRIDGISVDKALEMPDIEDREEKIDKQFKIRRRIANMGIINPDAKKEYEVLKERFDFLNDQVQDLNSAKLSLSKIDKIIEDRMKDDFINTFDEINLNFQEIFAILFPGGKARLELENADDPENCGVEVKAQPYGKHISKMSLLSGGEKSLVALCLLFAVYKKRSTPFYILDEVEAALDDTNLRRLIKYLEDLRSTTQLIMITHQRRTMEMSDVLYGVSMKNDGVTNVVSQKLDKDNKLHNIDK